MMAFMLGSLLTLLADPSASFSVAKYIFPSFHLFCASIQVHCSPRPRADFPNNSPAAIHFLILLPLAGSSAFSFPFQYF